MRSAIGSLLHALVADPGKTENQMLNELEKVWDIVQLGDLARVDEDEEGFDDNARQHLLQQKNLQTCAGAGESRHRADRARADDDDVSPLHFSLRLY